MERYQDKKVVIIGGTSGMGLATAKMLLDGGARVLVTGRSQAGLDSAQKELGKNAVVVSSDARSLTDIDALASRVKAEFDTFDLLFVNAGFSLRAPLESMTEAVCQGRPPPRVRRDFHDRRRASGRWRLVAALKAAHATRFIRWRFHDEAIARQGCSELRRDVGYVRRVRRRLRQSLSTQF